MLLVFKTIFKSLGGNSLRAVSAILAGIIFGAPVLGLAAQETGVVASYKLNVRKTPSQKGKVVKVLDMGTKVVILERLDGWLKILHEGDMGYVRHRNRYIRVVRDEKGRRDKKDLALKVRDEAASIKRKMERQTEQIRKFTEEEMQIIHALDGIEQAIHQAQKKIRTLKPEIAVLSNKIKENERKLKTLSTVMTQNEVYTGKRLTAIYKLRKMGIFNSLATSESLFDLFIRKKYIEYILSSDMLILNKHLENKKRLLKLESELKAQKDEKKGLDHEFQKQLKILNNEKQKRVVLLADVRNKKTLMEAAAETTRQASREVNKIIQSLGKNLFKTKQSNQPECLKSKIEPPVNGAIVSRFGPSANAPTFQSGIEIKAELGEPIHAICKGVVLFAGWLKGYGNMMIINHGQHYYSLYAHAEELFKDKGDGVEKREVIATVGETGSLSGAKLHFEIRHHGIPTDPMKWLR